MAVVRSNWNTKMVGAVVALEAMIPTVQNQLVALFQGLSTVVKEVEDKANALGTVLGQRGFLLEAGVTLWDAVAQSVSIGTNAESLAKSVTKDVVTVDHLVNKLEKSFQDHVKEVVQVVGKIHGAMAQATTSHCDLSAKVSGLERTGTNFTSRLSAVFSEATGVQTEDLKAELSILKLLFMP